MTNKRSTKKVVITSAISMLLCFSMLLGMTFAWFTDSVKSENNIIQSGDLKVKMYWAEGKEDPSTANWKDASQGAIFKNNKWEPGYTEVRHIKIANAGSLSLQYKVLIVANGEVTELADVIDVYYVDPAVQVANREALANAPKLGTLTEVLSSLDETGSGYLAAGESDTITLALKMQESAGNEYQNLALCDGGFTVQVIATQATGENDSFGNDYDKNAVADFFPGFQGGSAVAAVIFDENGLTTTEASADGGDVSVVIPAGVKLADGVNSLGLTVVVKNSSESNVQLNENEKMSPLDVHIEGVAEDNTTPMLVTLKRYMTTGINTGAIRMYHVENGVTVPMTQVAIPANHNEFSYDPATGDVTLALASFSEVAVIADTNNPWNGETLNYLWYATSATELTIYNADQLAGFAAIVDGKAEGIAQDSFAGKTVKLGNNIYLSGELFDPIGWGYVNAGWNRDGVAGKVFQGTFDGNGKTIFDLYQDGWDLESETGTDYTYTNCGFGLFAAASGATFMNLTISGAYVRAECVEMGVLVGLSQNTCTYNNIKILNSKIANYQRPAGGLIGEVSGDGTTTITNVIIGDDVVVGSLWGDFDAPVGGVIGAYWNDVNADPQIYMTNVDVGCRLDVYNDITSAYQWHAYRRAGMLIGNTDMSDPNNAHKAYAPFLTCENVKVYYGDWVNYTYCSFSNHNERYPWVRTQAGENCTAFSNPRWGVPNDKDGNRVTDMNHVHAEGDECNVLRQFSQLYGGGQGVYGQDKHDGVTYPKTAYSITYVNDNKTLDIIYVTDNAKAVTVGSDQAEKLVKEWASTNITGTWEFGGWMNAGSTKVESIPADNTKNIVLYPYFNKPYTARFVDQQGNVVAWCLFHKEDLTKLDAAKAAAEAALPYPGDDFELSWEVHINKTDSGYPTYDVNNFANYTQDVTVYPVYEYTGNLRFTPIDNEGDGIIDYYQIDAIDVLDEITKIPGYVNGVPVKVINKLYANDGNWDYGSGVTTIIVGEGVETLKQNSLAYTEDLSRVELPSTLTTIEKNAFSRNNSIGAIVGQGDVKKLDIYFNGTMAQWKALNKASDWHNGLKKGSRVICIDGYFEQTGREILGVPSSYTWTEHPNNG